MNFIVMELSALTAISPLDGRYGRQTAELRDIFSEFALMRARVTVEVEWLIALSEFNLPELKDLSEEDKLYLRGLVSSFSVADCQAIKDIEKTTNHDVKAVEYWIKSKMTVNEHLAAASEFVHFGCTSEDINNTSHALMLSSGRQLLCSHLQLIIVSSKVSLTNGPVFPCSPAPMASTPLQLPSVKRWPTLPLVSNSPSRPSKK